MFVVIAYYTDDNIYRSHAQRLRCSCTGYGIPADIVCIDSLGNWDKNTHYKPTFIRKMMDKHPDKAIAYTDADSEFVAYPHLFKQLNCPIAAHLLDHSKYGRRKRAPELLSGTLFFNNSQQSKDIVAEWVRMCAQQPKQWDQKVLAEVVGDDFYNLPAGYCQIFDYMKDMPDPVVRHYQASRTVRLLEKNNLIR